MSLMKGFHKMSNIYFGTITGTVTSHESQVGVYQVPADRTPRLQVSNFIATDAIFHC